MTKLGTSLAFWFKYPSEMERLCYPPKTAKPPVIDGLTKDVQLKLAKVGEAARLEAAAFLRACAEKIEPQLQSVGIPRRFQNSLGRTWELKWRLSPKRQPNQLFNIGVYIDAEIVPFIGCRGRTRAIEQVVSFLESKNPERPIDKKITHYVVLDRIKVEFSGSPHSFDVDQEPLVERVCKALTLDVADVKAIARIAARTGG